MAGWLWDEHLQRERIWSAAEESWVLRDGTRIGNDYALAILHQAAIRDSALAQEEKSKTEAPSSYSVASKAGTASHSGQASRGPLYYDADDLTAGLQAMSVGKDRKKQTQESNLVYKPTDNDERRQITDPHLLNLGAESTTRVSGLSPNDKSEPTDPRYKLRGAGWFKKGKVFKVMWPESALNENSSVMTSSAQRYEAVRWFVVVREGPSYCSCVSAQTYGGAGVAYAGVNRNEHAILYNGKREPKAAPSERNPKSHGGMKSPIRVKPARPTITLDEMLRVNFAKIYTIDNNVKVFDVGEVASENMRRLDRHFEDCWFSSKHTATTGYNEDEEENDDDDENLYESSSRTAEYGPSDAEVTRVNRIVESWVRTWKTSGRPEDHRKAQVLESSDYAAQKRFLSANGVEFP